MPTQDHVRLAITRELEVVGISNEEQLPGDGIVRLTFFQLGDAAALRDMDADPEHRRRFEFPETFVASLAHSRKVISDWTNQREDGPFVFAVRAVTNGELLVKDIGRLRERP